MAYPTKEQKMLNKDSNVLKAAILFGSLFAISACTPTVRVAVPDKPIEINLNLNINMKIEHNLRVQMEKDLEQAAKANPGIF